MRVPRPARPRRRALGIAGLSVLTGLVGGAVAGLLRAPLRAGEGR